MGIVKRDINNVDGLSILQSTVLNILSEYDYEIADLRYIEELKQVIITIKGIVLFVDINDMSMSFEINASPETVSTIILILAEKIKSTIIHVTDSFYITDDIKGNKIALFGSDAKKVYERGLINNDEDNKYLNILRNENIKFYEC